MIQRIQSLYLFLITALSLFFLSGSFLNFSDKSGSVIKITFTSIIKSTGGQGFESLDRLWPLSIISVLIVILSFVTIFFYNKRNVQLWLSKILTLVICGLILILVYYSYVIITRYNGRFVPGITMVLLLLILIFSVLAARGIKKDDQLVKSYDRLR